MEGWFSLPWEYSLLLSEKNQSDKSHMISHIGGILKNDTNELIHKAEIDL